MLIRIARQDGIISEQEAEEIEAFAGESYVLSEEATTVQALCAQLTRRGLVSPNVSMWARINDLVRLRKQKKSRIAEDESDDAA